LLLRAGHDVTFIGRQPHVDAINAHGLLLDTKTFNGHLPAKAATDATALASPDLALVCVKSADTEQAGRSLAGRLLPETSVLSLQNGVDNAPRLSAVTGHAVIPVVVTSAARWPGPAMSGITAAATAIGPPPRAKRWRNACSRRHRHHDRR
jgi:2-dehydropantoate 2-reductase